MKKKICLFVMVALMAFLMILPASASCDDCINHTDSFDWSNHCEANCTCSWGPCPYCGESGAYVEDFCNSVHSYEWSQTSDTSHTGICACGDSVEEECDMVVVSNVEATCDDEGYCVYECSTCGAEYREVLYAPGHEWEETTCDDPTCTVPGIQRYECSVCGESQAETIDALGHSYTATVIAPSCTTGGWTTHICSRCSDTYTDNETAATGHSWTETECEAPTCLSTGKQHYACSACGETQTDTIAALGHDFSVQQIIDPTCTSTGHTRMNCSRCDAYEIVEGSETDIVEHIWQDSTCEDATCTENGIQYQVCIVCNGLRSIVIEAYGHEYEDGICIVCGAIASDGTDSEDPKETDSSVSESIDPDIPEYTHPEESEGREETNKPDGGFSSDSHASKDEEIDILLIRVAGFIGFISLILWALSFEWQGARRKRRKRR